MTSLCNNTILLFEFILQCFIAAINIYSLGRVHSSRLNNEELQTRIESKMLINHHFDI